MSDQKKGDPEFSSALRVQEGIEPPGQVSSKVVQQLQKARKPVLTAQQYVEGIRSGNRTILSQAITLVESALPTHQLKAQEVIVLCLKGSGNSLRIGITGVPGVGKSTFIEAFGSYLTGKGHQVAVLAIDPSSQRSKGSILGDKTRMESLANDPLAFIRPSPSAGSLGGVARKTRETMVLCEAAGFDIVLVETVGVGQSETAVHGMVDFFLLLMLPGAGDELQGIKRGIMEMADALVINKADGDQLTLAKLARTQYQNALHLYPPSASGWVPRVISCSALSHSGMAEVWELVLAYREHTTANGFLAKKRLTQSRQIMYDTIEDALRHDFYRHPEVVRMMARMEEDLRHDKISSYVAAQQLLEVYFRQRK